MIGSISARQRGDGDVDLFLVEVGDLVEHLIERAGLLADADHLHDHRREDLGLEQRLGHVLAFADPLRATYMMRLLDDDVAGGLGARSRARRGSARRTRAACRACA